MDRPGDAVALEERAVDDGVLVRAVQHGDYEAFADLFRRHYPVVRRACARRLSDRVEADEVAQAAFVRAFERIDRCGGDRRFGPWVQVIARHLCVDTVRGRARVVPTDVPLPAPDAAGATEGPEERALDRERARTVRHALAALPERQRRAVIAREVEDRRPPEIAAALGLSLPAVDSLLLRGRRRLALVYRRQAGA